MEYMKCSPLICCAVIPSFTDVGNLQTLNLHMHFTINLYEGWNFNSGNYLFTTDTK